MLRNTLRAASLYVARLYPQNDSSTEKPIVKRKLRDTAYLDGLKACAAFMVYIHHMTMRHYPDLPSWYGRFPETYQLIRLPLLRDLYVSGQSMVGIFFVVSGFILTTKPLQLIRKQDHAALYKTIASCMFRRWFRLWLPAFFSTFIAVLAIRMDLKLDSPEGPNQHPKLPTFGAQVLDWLNAMLRFSTPFQYSDQHSELRMKYDHVTWTLPLEYWAGMSIWVVCMALCQFPRYFVRLTILLMLCYYSLWNGSWHFFCFLSGMILADFQIEYKNKPYKGKFFEIFTHERRQFVYWCIFVFGLYIAGAPGAPAHDMPKLPVPGYRWIYATIPNWFHEPYRYTLAWTGVCIVFATNRIRTLQKLFESDLAQGFSKCSFPFFLLHQVMHDILVKNWLEEAIPRWLHLDMKTTLGHNIWFFTMLFMSTPMIYAASRLFQTYIDNNCTKFAKWLEEQLRKPGIQSPLIAEQIMSEDIDVYASQKSIEELIRENRVHELHV